MKRLKKILKWTGIVLSGLVAIGLVANAVFVWTTDIRLERQLAAIREAGDPVSLAELAPKPIPPEENAATYLRRAQADVDAMSNEIYNKDYFDNWGKRWKDEHVLPPDGLKAVKASFEAHPNVMPLLERAAACTEYNAGLDYSLAPDQFIEQLTLVAQGMRADSGVLQCRVYLLLAEGKRDEAVQISLVLFRLARLCERNPMLFSYLVATTLRRIAVNSVNTVLQSGPISKEVRDALDAELAIQERMEGFVWALKSDRPNMLSYMDTLPGRNVWFIGRGIWNIQESVCLDIYPTLIALAGDPGPYREVEQTIESKKSTMAALLFPGLKAAYVTVTRTRAEIRSLRVLNALQTHVPAESNEVPKLTELGLPAETITDPFTGEPLHVKKTSQGWLVYSVGPNFQDDGGKLDDSLNGDVGVGPPPATAKNDQEE